MPLGRQTRYNPQAPRKWPRFRPVRYRSMSLVSIIPNRPSKIWGAVWSQPTCSLISSRSAPVNHLYPTPRRRLAFEVLGPRQLLANDSTAGIGLLGQYYDNADLTGLAFVRIDPTANFDWSSAAPAPGIAPDSFSVRWSGELESQFTSLHSFHLSGDDGARLWVDGNLIIDRWNSTPVNNATGTIQLTAGRKYDIVLEYFDNIGNASIRLEWSSAHFPREIVPMERLFPAQRGSVSREVWTNVPGSLISELTILPNYPGTPNVVGALPTFETPIDLSDNFGQRIRGILYPPTTGDYSFYVSANEAAELWISNSVDANNKMLAASTSSATAYREWNKFPQQRSTVLSLVAGQGYYIEALHKESSGADHLSVGWTLPGKNTIEVIAGEFLAPVTPEISLFVEQASMSEGSLQPSVLTVVRSGASAANAITVEYAIRGNATNSVDYSALSGSITIPAGQISANINITATSDAFVEGNETLVVEIKAGTGYRVGRTSQRIATVTIQDDVTSPSGGTSLLSGASLSNFIAFGGTFSTVNVPTYGNVIQAVITTQFANTYDAQLRQHNSSAIQVGDVLFAEFSVRTLTATGSLSAVFETNGPPYAKSLEQGIRVTSEWSKIQLPFLSDEAYAVGQAAFEINLGAQIQTLQFAGFQLRNLGPSSDLVRSDGLHLNKIGGSFGNMQLVPVEGPSFTSAYQINTVTPPPNNEFWRLQAAITNSATVQSGDSLRIEFWARSISGVSPRISVALQQAFGNFTTLASFEINAVSNWQKYTYNVTAPGLYSVQELQVVLNVGYGSQTVQIGDFKWENRTRGIDIRSLPERYPVPTYSGRSGTDAWRAESQARIAQNRMSQLQVSVVDSNGTALDGAVVYAIQKEHEFKLGSALSGYGDLLSAAGGPQSQQYQSEILRLFNSAVIENNLKWIDFANNRQLGIDAANWVHNSGLYLRGHNVIWPSRSAMPAFVWNQFDTLSTTQGLIAARAYLRTQLNERVIDAANTFEGKVGEWDIVNEPYSNTDVMSELGNSELLEWYRLFRVHDAEAKRTLNDFDIFARNGKNTAHRANFDNWLGLLTAQNLIETLGEQSHYSESNLTDIDVLGQLIQTYYSTYSRPIAITEFDFNTRNEQLQTDYFRDYLTMAFSQPAIDSFSLWGFWSGAHWLPDAALYRKDFSIKPNGQAFEDLVFGEWWSETRGTSRSGQVQAKVFQGEYQVKVTIGGQVVELNNVQVGAGTTSVQVVVPGNRVPTGITLSNQRIVENAGPDAIVGLFSTVDPDPGNSFTYSLVGGAGSSDNGLFRVVGNQLQAFNSFDFETRAAYSVRVRSADPGGYSTESTWTIAIQDVNEAPELSVSINTVVGNVLSTVSNMGAWKDPEGASVMLSASIGSIVSNPNGTWNWSYTPSTRLSQQTVVVTATDATGLSTVRSFSLDALTAIVNRKVYYRGSDFEVLGGVEAALDTSKVVARAGSAAQATTFANVINYTRGINGVVLDIAGLASNSISAGDLSVRVSPTGASGVVSPGSWQAAPTPTVFVTPGTSTQPARVRLEWADLAIQNCWLQIIVQANANTGLVNREVLYLGHAFAELSGQEPYRVTAVDLSMVQTAISVAIVGVSDVRDINKDRRVTAVDLSNVQSRISNLVLLGSITVPSSGSMEEGEAGTVLEVEQRGRALPIPATMELQAGLLAMELSERSKAPEVSLRSDALELNWQHEVPKELRSEREDNMQGPSRGRWVGENPEVIRLKNRLGRKEFQFFDEIFADYDRVSRELMKPL
ncbi:MAG: PA14 domain-containing protein [Pirellula sp.]